MSDTKVTPADLQRAIRNIPDFPQPGIQFKDITPVLADARLLAGCVELLTAHHPAGSVDAVVGIDARGFIFAAAAAMKLRAGFVPVRKLGRLPAEAIRAEYELEYGTNTLEIHADAARPGQRVLVVDDLLATGGTAAASVDLVKRLGADVVGMSFLIELADLRGRARLGGERVHSVIRY